MNLDFCELNSTYFSISNFFAARQFSLGKSRFEMQRPRHSDAIILFSTTNSICYQEGEPPLYIPCGSLVFVPKDSKYIWEDTPAFDDNGIEKFLFEFTLNRIDISKDEQNKIFIQKYTDERIVLGNKVFIISSKYDSLFKKSFVTLIDAFKNQGKYPLGAYSAAYDFFNTVSDTCKIKDESTADISIIKKGIEYIENTPCPQKSIKEIAQMCGVSVGYFEQIFKAYAQVTPKEYINFNKILHIKKMLQNKSLTLDEIAEKMNYCDSGYLCRIFKKKTGISPKQYRRLYFSSIER